MCPCEAWALPAPISHPGAPTGGSSADKSLTLPKSKNVFRVKHCEKTASFVGWREQGQRFPPRAENMALMVTEFLACENILGESYFFSLLLSGPQAAEEDAFHCLRSYSVGLGRGRGGECSAPPQEDMWAEMWVLYPIWSEQIKGLGFSLINQTS